MYITGRNNTVLKTPIDPIVITRSILSAQFLINTLKAAKLTAPPKANKSPIKLSSSD
jgi:hypothetical protein